MNSSHKFFSFNSSTGSRNNAPLAESTAIGSPMMQPGDSFRGNQKRKTISPLANANKQRQSMVQIEPHVLTNAQSRGIVKRLVTYYDESQSDGDRNRYVYNRIGDFPLVQLKKTEIKCNLVRSSSVRIAPPNKTMMNRDIRAAILRSNSFQIGANVVPKLIPVKMRAKDDSHQIITNHDPLLIESPQAANSALEALEKNCRKRFNNEELTIDRNKRICATTAQQEIIDGPSIREFAPIAPPTVKRNREQSSPNQKSPDSPNGQQRKKPKTRNNAYLSSLSSSQFLLKPYNSSQSVGGTLTTQPIINQPIAQLERQVKPLKVALAPVISVAKKEPPVVNPAPSAKPVEKRLHLFNVRFDASTAKSRVINLDDNEDGEPKISFVKPREKSQVQDVDICSVEKEKLSMMLSGLSGDLDSPTKETPRDYVDAPVTSAPASITFTTTTTSSTIAPITTPALVTNSPPSIPSTTNSLPTPLVKGSESTFATSAPSTSSSVSFLTSTAEAPKTLPSFQFGVATTATTIATTSTSTVTDFASSAKIEPLSLFSSPAESTQKPATSIDPNKSLMTFTPVKPAEVTSTPTIVSSSTGIVPTTTAAPSLSSIASSGRMFEAVFGSKEPPKMSGGFNFGNTSSDPPASSTTLNSTFTTAPPVTSPPSFNFQASTKSTFSFGSTPKTSPTTLGSQLNDSGVKPLLGNIASPTSFMQKPETTTASGIGFSFSNTQAPNPKTNPIMPTTTATGGFSFATQNTMTGSALPAPVTTASSFNFGSSTNSAFGQPTTSPPLVFGQTRTSTPVAFGQPVAPSFGQPSTEPSSFTGFGQKSNPQPSTGGSFSLFGQKPAAPVVTTAASTFAFGSSNAVTVTTQSPGFSFGQSNQAMSPPAAQALPANSGGSIFSRLGDKHDEVKPAFSFGGNNQPAPANTSSLFGSSNSSGATAGGNLFGSSSTPAFNQSTPLAGGNMFGNSNQPNSFGGDNKQTFAFGASNNVQSTQPAPQLSQANSMFNFGNSSSSSVVQSPTSTNIFGGNAGSNSTSASFTFKPSTGTVTSHQTPAFGQNQIPSAGPPPAYQFGQQQQQQQQQQNNVSASFNFSGASSAQTAAPSGFNFNGPQSAPTNGAFNFQNQQMQAPQPSSSMFNIGTGGNQQRRPIRTATRRMK